MLCSTQPCKRRTPSITCIQGESHAEATFLMEVNTADMAHLQPDCYEQCIERHVHNVTMKEHQQLLNMVEEKWRGYRKDTFMVGTYSLQCRGGYSMSDLMCTPCYPGSISSGVTRCVPCAKNMYQPQYAQEECVPCPSNHTTRSEGGRSENECQTDQLGRGTIVEDFVESQLDRFGITMSPFWVSMMASLAVSGALTCFCCIVCCCMCCKH